MGFPLITCPGIRAATQRWDTLRVDWERGVVVNERTGQALPFEPWSSTERATIEAGVHAVSQSPAGARACSRCGDMTSRSASCCR